MSFRVASAGNQREPASAGEEPADANTHTESEATL